MCQHRVPHAQAAGIGQFDECGAAAVIPALLARARAARATMKFVATDAEISRFKREGRA